MDPAGVAAWPEPKEDDLSTPGTPRGVADFPRSQASSVAGSVFEMITAGSDAACSSSSGGGKASSSGSGGSGGGAACSGGGGRSSAVRTKAAFFEALVRANSDTLITVRAFQAQHSVSVACNSAQCFLPS